MLKHALLIIALLAGVCLYAQDPEAAIQLVRQGVALHDERAYEQALAKYDEALRLDSANFYALAEKTVTLFHMGRTEECIALSESILDTHGAHDEIGMVYIAYANSLDHAKRPQEALKIYARGQEVDPGNFQLWFNEAITLVGLERYDEAVERLERSLQLNPRHGSSHNAMGRIMLQKKARIPALLALSRFLIVEPESNRSALALPLVQEQMRGSVEKNKKGGLTIYVDASDLPAEGDTTRRANDFSAVTMFIDLLGAAELDKKSAKKTEVEKFTHKFNMLCGLLDESKDKHHGFFWEYYAPYFREMKEQGHVETAVMVMHASAGDPVVNKWLKKNSKAIDAFFEWSSAYAWER
jgi:tetratricopeptide (TPR) repeat protein